MREDAAKHRWCPFGRTYGPVAWNRTDGGEAGASPCLGSGCAVWRWSGAATGYCGLAGMPTGYEMRSET